jgi:hypothetical protein
MAGMSQEGAVPQDTAAAAERVFHALVFGSLQDMATGATEVCSLVKSPMSQYLCLSEL